MLLMAQAMASAQDMVGQPLRTHLSNAVVMSQAQKEQMMDRTQLPKCQ